MAVRPPRPRADARAAVRPAACPAARGAADPGRAARSGAARPAAGQSDAVRRVPDFLDAAPVGRVGTARRRTARPGASAAQAPGVASRAHRRARLRPGGRPPAVGSVEHAAARCAGRRCRDIENGDVGGSLLGRVQGRRHSGPLPRPPGRCPGRLGRGKPDILHRQRPRPRHHAPVHDHRGGRATAIQRLRRSQGDHHHPQPGRPGQASRRPGRPRRFAGRRRHWARSPPRTR